MSVKGALTVAKFKYEPLNERLAPQHAILIIYQVFFCPPWNFH